jgi:hypothetical protein
MGTAGFHEHSNFFRAVTRACSPKRDARRDRFYPLNHARRNKMQIQDKKSIDLNTIASWIDLVAKYPQPQNSCNIHDSYDQLEILKKCQDTPNTPTLCAEAETKLADFLYDNKFRIADRTGFGRQDPTGFQGIASYVKQFAENLRKTARQTFLVESIGALAKKLQGQATEGEQKLFSDFLSDCKDFQSGECGVAKQKLSDFLYDNKDRLTQQLVPGGQNDLDGLQKNFGTIIDIIKGLRGQNVI